jgi:hypothetical protein
MNKFHKIKLIGLNDRAKKIISYYQNNLSLIEYDNMGNSLSISPNGKQGIFCVSPDGFWRGWFVLDDDVRVLEEQNKIDAIISSLKES